RAHPDLVLAAEVECDPVSADLDVALPERRDSVRPRLLRIPLGARPKPAEVDQTKRDRADALAVEMAAVHVLGHRRPDLRQLLAEADELVVLRLLLLRAVVLRVQVLLAARLVVADCLELCPRTRRDPHVAPRRWDL